LVDGKRCDRWTRRSSRKAEGRHLLIRVVAELQPAFVGEANVASKRLRSSAVIRHVPDDGGRIRLVVRIDRNADGLNDGGRRVSAGWRASSRSRPRRRHRMRLAPRRLLHRQPREGCKQIATTEMFQARLMQAVWPRARDEASTTAPFACRITPSGVVCKKMTTRRVARRRVLLLTQRRWASGGHAMGFRWARNVGGLPVGFPFGATHFFSGARLIHATTSARGRHVWHDHAA
jgi:hypothetical protein